MLRFPSLANDKGLEHPDDRVRRTTSNLPMPGTYRRHADAKLTAKVAGCSIASGFLVVIDEIALCAIKFRNYI